MSVVLTSVLAVAVSNGTVGATLFLFFFDSAAWLVGTIVVARDADLLLAVCRDGDLWRHPPRDGTFIITSHRGVGEVLFDTLLWSGLRIPHSTDLEASVLFLAQWR